MRNTICHLNGTPDHTNVCPQGGHFEIKDLERYGGTRRCSHLSCPHQQKDTGTKVQVILVGTEDAPHAIVATKA